MHLNALVGGAAEVIGPETPLRTAAGAMVAADVGAVAVVDGRELVGIFTDRDLARAAAESADFDADPVSSWMSESPDTFDPNVRVSEAAEWLLEVGYRHLPVMEGDELLGIVDIRDVLWALTKT
jgi:CBS domain-containing protein